MSAPAPASFPEPLTIVDRQTVRALSLSGLTDNDIIRRFPGLKHTTVRQWRMRDPVWAAAFAAIRAKSKAQAIAVTEQRVESVTNAITGTVSELHAGTALQLVKASAQAIGQFAMSPAPITDWQAASVAYKVQRLAAGIDKEGNEVRVNVAMFSESGTPDTRLEESPGVWDCDPAMPDSEPIEADSGPVG